MSRHSSGVPTNYLQISPVRGQLEPLEPGARTGWRYLQCTDTPNELKVLLPPKTALLYSALIQAEASELAQGKNTSWDRIMKIRHLKDRMLRKCQRLARVTSPKQPVAFRTVHAPADFRMKELEKWVKDEGIVVTEEPPPVTPRHSVESLRSRGTCDCATCRRKAAANRPMTQSPKSSPRASLKGQRPSYLKPSRSASSLNAAKRASVASFIEHHIPEPVQVFHVEMPTAHPSMNMPSPLFPPDASQLRASTPLPQSPNPVPLPMPTDQPSPIPERIDVRSPEPLPVPFRDSTLGTPYGAPVSMPIPEVSGVPIPHSAPEAMLPAPQATTTTVPAGFIPEEPPRPAIPRRRSSLKQSSAFGRLSTGSAKSVAWAMDRDWIEQITQYERAITDLEVAGNEVDEIRASYQVQMSEVKDFRKHVNDALNRLQLDMERLRHGEDKMRALEDRLRSNYELLENKGKQYQIRAHAALEETKRVVQLCNKKRDKHEP
ncbi:hypothetical protein JAAARDRAFT_29617 [Jaapia argillacea MUCL 33604]|uniref:Uncharacterized protein n=1 Tax=Jaapia argillacea MUCL 33604 TaxID=933084 RepID=A0A067QBQ4_9AGAM|nr:hypothetical protein JAAARDRAFT_29617 [Jaapia argillacea MUCL 33604]